METFQEWLTSWLRDMKTDEAVFGPYIISILEGDDEEEDRIEALDGILQELDNGKNVTKYRTEIIDRWKKSLLKVSSSDTGNQSNEPSASGGQGEATGESSNVLGDQLDELLRIANEDAANQSGSHYSKSKQGTDQKLRAAILSNLSDESSDADDDPVETSPGPAPSTSSTGKKKSDLSLMTDFGRNVNVEKVLNEQKETRDKAKAEHAVKKERDKEDRAKQKAAAAERKEKAKKKATKVERKR